MARPFSAAPSGALRDPTRSPATSLSLHGPLKARILGDHGPLVVAFHGLAESGRYWQPVVAGLIRDHRVVLIDLLGFGHSPRPDLGYSAASHADAVAATLAGGGLGGEPAVLLAHQAGVTVAMTYARHRPETVRAIVGLGTPWFRSPGEARRALRGPWWMSRWLVEHTERAQLLCRTVCGGRSILVPRVARWFVPGDVPDEVIEDAFLHSWQSFSQTLDSCMLRAALNDIVGADFPVPSLLLHGDDDTVVPIENLLDARPSRPALTVEMVAARGHNLVWTDPDLVSAAVADTAKRHPAGVAKPFRSPAAADRRPPRGAHCTNPSIVPPTAELTVEEAARLVRVSRRTVQTWVGGGRIRSRRHQGRTLVERISLLEHVFGSEVAARELLAGTWLSAAQAAARLGVGHATVARYVATNRIPSHRVAGRRVFLAVELDAGSAAQ